MRLSLRLDRQHLRRWHAVLAARLAALPGLGVSVDYAATSAPGIEGVEMLFQLEALLHRLPKDGLSARIASADLEAFSRTADSRPDLTLDLTGSTDPATSGVWRLTFDGEAGEAALLALLLAGRTPCARISGPTGPVAEGRLGTEYGGVLLASFEDILARTITLIVAAISGCATQPVPALPGEGPSPESATLPATTRLAVIAARKVASAVLRRIYQLCYNAPHWRTGWRKLDGPDLYDLRRHPDTGWQDLPDDGQRFYADPFPIEVRGQTILFLEDYAHRLGKGIISAVAFDDNGPVGTPVPVLEQPGHLSYPFVFERDGDIWMIPESGSAGTIDLFRATAFPGGWVREATLVANVVASDATLVEHGGRWWIFATVRDGGGAFSDALHLWSAPDFRGPYAPHPRNPVLIDIASARPAGRMVYRGGALLRPVQDCRNGYGAALAIARVTRLDDEDYQQVVETILTPGPLWPGRRLHSLNSAGGLEFIDGSRFARRRLIG